MHKTKTTTRQIETLYRNFEIRAVSEENRTVELSFSSEEPYERYWGIEVLDHSPTSVNLSRLNNAAPLLLNHDTYSQIGVVESAAISSERKGVATVRFSRSELGDEVFQDVVDGIRKNVSVGYQIEEMMLESRDGDTETYRVTKWMPFEVSIVSVPADTSVGVGRAHDESRATVTVIVVEADDDDDENENPINESEDGMEEDNVVIPPVETEEKTLEVKTEKRSNDAGEILSLGERFGQRDAAVEAVKSGLPLEAFRVQVMDKLETKSKEKKVNSNSGDFLTEKEKGEYSLMRALRDAANGKRDTFEMRVGEEAARANGIEARGLYIPADMLMRTMSVTDTGFGGNTVSTNIASGSFIDILRSKSVVMALATKLDGLTGNVQIPRQSGASVVYKPAEKVAITQGDVATDFITLSPNRYGASVPVTKQLLMQSSLAVENMIRNDIAAQIALAIESDVISAILAGATTVSLGTNGAVPTWQNFIDLETAVTAANADMGRLAYLINAKGRGKLKSTPKVAGFPEYIIDKDGAINGYEQLMTNLVPSNLTKGTGTLLSAAIFGNFDDALIATWGGLDIVMDIYTQAKEGIINITADQFADYDLRHTASFAAIKDMVTV
jgi:HK97 family phage major capsid protein